MRRREHTAIWLCVDCMVLHANGELPTDPNPEEPEPLCLIGPGEQLTAGMLAEEHECGWTGWSAERPECDCERQEFGRHRCGGCGTDLAGERHAATLWWTSEEG